MTRLFLIKMISVLTVHKYTRSFFPEDFVLYVLLQKTNICEKQVYYLFKKHVAKRVLHLYFKNVFSTLCENINIYFIHSFITYLSIYNVNKWHLLKLNSHIQRSSHSPHLSTNRKTGKNTLNFFPPDKIIFSLF